MERGNLRCDTDRPGTVGESETPNGDEAITVEITRNQVLLVLVNPFDDTTNGIAHTGSCNLALTCTAGASIPVEPEPEPIGDDENEPNDVTDTAVELFCASTRILSENGPHVTSSTGRISQAVIRWPLT